MRSPVYLERAPISTTPGQLPRFRIEEVASVEINLPLLDEQKRMSSRLSQQMDRAERTRKALEEQLATINKLPAALLRQAFRANEAQASG
jgi:type I restriction enzyme S subunit